jgi:hypothetical protein
LIVLGPCGRPWSDAEHGEKPADFTKGGKQLLCHAPPAHPFPRRSAAREWLGFRLSAVAKMTLFTGVWRCGVAAKSRRAKAGNVLDTARQKRIDLRELCRSV